jgi:hypothetical protein
MIERTMQFFFQPMIISLTDVHQYLDE